jgi:glycosyltransferase involved in cell wall biosynthesis
VTALLRFSVVVPAHDEADLLPATLASLRAQDFQDGYEVIVVDNASRDGTAAVAEALGVRVVVEPQLGVCRARQRGVDVAYGEIIVSTDADTRHPPDWLSRIDAAFAAGGPEVVAVAGPCRYADPPWWAALVPPLWFSGIAAAAGRAGWVPYLTATNVAFRRAGFPGYDESLAFGGDEVDLLRRLRGCGRIVWLADNAVTTSSRRLAQGLLHTVLVSYGYHYALAQLVNRLAGRPVISPPPAIRHRHTDQVRRRRRQWRLAGLGFAVLAGLLRLVGARAGGQR